MPSNLLKQIELKRNEMINIGMKYGLSSIKTIKSSQELDDLLNLLYQSKQIVNKKHLT
ncbi:Spo0E family sporulation regulatory protein-aspartic acid phosphatase [Alkalihalobacterium alkalinitrilicum]|uniref:Spo0E family sporulation regulatory protein-aspartic acid phosphatase n=1 Tax=Alkalihalobacterium alkalinitrilicum TaxID=427920 RepID=UPI000994EC7D|nr:aspartyl-phosphate phosphatase Spo0E family protein [Alkalihalobacterium alkalinitrilicum]